MTYGLVAVGLAFCAWSLTLDRPSYSYAEKREPMAIAVAFDLSPSMLAVPDPAFYGEVAPRYVRARAVLLELFAELEERRESVLVALIGYTKRAEILMGWDDSPSQLREIIAYGLSPGLHTTTGTSVDAAVGAIIDVFGMLPPESRDAARRLAIIVSDGEDSLPRSFLGYALEELASETFDVVALQAGLLDTNEGVPRYGEIGEFIGFEAMSGNLYTVPDAEAMTALASATGGRGLHVRAEDPAAAAKLLRFAVDARTGNGYLDERLFAILGMFTVVTVLCARSLL